METKIAILRTQENAEYLNSWANEHCKDTISPFGTTTNEAMYMHYPAHREYWGFKFYKSFHAPKPGYTLISSLPEFIEEWEKAYGQKQPCTCRNHVYAENCNINYGHGEEPDRKSELLSLYREYMELSDGFLKMVTHFNASDEMKDKFTSLRTRIAEIEKQQTI